MVPRNAPFLPRISKVLALVFVTLTVAALVANKTYPRVMDFLSFWAAGQLAVMGAAANAYDPHLLHAIMAKVVPAPPYLPFVHLPPSLLLFAPLGLLPSWLAVMLWVGLTGGGYVWVGRRWIGGGGRQLMAFPPVLANALIGQVGFLAGGLLLGGLHWVRRRPLSAGLLLGGLIFKPQLGLLLPVAMLAGGHWRVIAGACLSAIALLVAALLAFGPHVYAAFFEMMPAYSAIAAESELAWAKLASIYGMMRLAGAPSGVAWAMQAAVAFASALLVWRVWRGGYGDDAKGAVLLAATATASPYIFLYDIVFLAVPLLWLARQGVDRRLLILLWFWPLLGLAEALGLGVGSNLIALAPLATLALTWRAINRASDSAPGDFPEAPLHRAG